ncbi:MAG: hypothetical protein C0467_02855 [Planctomycetaceae bacterium]|nr:hypothetical protein [Planctomycetaceae bacterium]
MLILDDRKFIEAAFNSEDELERVVIANSEYLFGPSSLYFPKTLIKTKDGFGTIPDGFVVDLAARRWFIVEAELAKHSVWSHIAPQVAKQIIAAMNPASRQLLTDLIVEKVREDASAMEKFADEEIEVIDIRRVLGEILEDNPIVGMPIDAISTDLREWASTLKVSVKLWIVRKHVEFGHPEQVLYEIPEEFRPALDTEEDDPNSDLKARYDVTISDLLLGGQLHSGQKLVMNWKPRNGDKRVFEGLVRDGGEIEVLGKLFTSPSYAAVYAFQSAGSTRSTENGWVKWRTEGGVLLSTLREQYLQSHDGEET